MDWQTLGAIGGVLSFFVTLAAEWKRLRRLGLQRLLVPFLVGTVVFLAVSQICVMINKEVPVRQRQQPAEADTSIAEPASPTSGGLFLCGEPAFNGNLTTQDPLFLRPAGYLSGWISSDPSTVILPNGATKVFETQYVLIVEDLPSVQIKGVQRQAGKANTWGCWYSADLSSFISEDAMTDFCKKKAGGNVAVLYRVSSSGFQELATTATVSCP